MAKQVGIFFAGVLCGLLILKLWQGRSQDPVVFRMQNIEIHQSEFEKWLGNDVSDHAIGWRTHLRTRAQLMLQERLVLQQAQAANLSATDWMNKVKAEFQPEISDSALQKFIHDRGLDTKKISAKELADIRANMIEGKRDEYFTKYLQDKLLSQQKIEWLGAELKDP